MNYESADYKGGVSVGVRSCDVWLFGDEHTTIIGKLLDSNEFSKTITIGGKTMSAQDFLNNYTDNLVEYYHGEDAGIQYFYKVINGEGVVVAIDAATKVIIDGECRYIYRSENAYC